MSDVRDLEVVEFCRDELEDRSSNAGVGAAHGSFARWDLPSRQLARTIEMEIIPRLVLAHRAQPRPATRAQGGQVSMARVEEFTRLTLAREADVLLQYVEALGEQGVAPETLYLDLLAPAARRLGEYWEADFCDFTEVTVGLCRLQRVVRDLSPAFVADCEFQSDRRILLALSPGENHALGLQMLAEFFRRAGWDTWDIAPDSTQELAAIVRSEWFAVAGFSISCTSRLEGLAAAIRQVRKASCNRSLAILVGGNVFTERPELATLVGADCTAADGRGAVLEAQNLLWGMQRS